MTSRFCCGLGFPDDCIPELQQKFATIPSASSTGNTANDDSNRRSNIMTVIKVPVVPERPTPVAEAAAGMAVRADSYLTHRLVS